VFGNRQPGRLVSGQLRIAATDTSNPNQELHTRQHQMHTLHKPAFDCGWIPTPPVRTEGTGVACDVGGGRMTGPPEGLTWPFPGRGEAGTDQRPPASRAIVGLHGDRPIKITKGALTALMRGRPGSNRRRSALQLEVIAGQAHSYCSDPAQAEPASVVEPMDVAAGGTGRLGNPTSSRPTDSQCRRQPRPDANVFWDGSPTWVPASIPRARLGQKGSSPYR
jgi:hypothetical protein